MLWGCVRACVCVCVCACFALNLIAVSVFGFSLEKIESYSAKREKKIYDGHVVHLEKKKKKKRLGGKQADALYMKNDANVKK